MALKKNVETKRIVAYLLKVGAAILSSALLFACGGDSGNSSKAENEDEGREVATLVDMGRCTSEREGDTVYVAEKLTDYLCRNGSWIDLSKQDYLESSSSVVPDSSSVIPSDSEESSSSAVPGSSSQGNNTSDTLVVKKRSILGVAQKGPFKFGSPVYLRELSEENLDQTGMVYEDEISSNKGDFVIPNVNLNSPYAEVEVRGLYRNEVSGEYSKDSISLLALTDLKTDSRTKVNVNLLTHLEYKRAMYLVRKGYSVYAAKKQADQEIMTAFELPTTVKYSEDLSVFEDSEDDNVDYANASLMMLNLLFLGNRSDAEIKNAIDNFIADIEKDGSWEDDSTKAVMADFATEIDGDEIRANVKAWNILDIPKFEGQMEMFWNNVYGLGGCTSVRSGVITKNQNKYSKNFEVYYKCSEGRWVKATQFEYDTYGWSAGVVGEVKEGNVTDAKYVYRDGKWNQASALEDGLGSCLAKNEGTILTYGPSYGLDYYVCKSRQWTKLTVAEADVYGWSAGADGEVKKGSYTDTKYVYRDGAWSEAGANESSLGSCTTSNAKTIKNDQGSYYICENTRWKSLTTLEADTYGWDAGETGEVKKGTYTDAKYVYRNSKWNAASSVENALGSCTTKNAKTIFNEQGSYYICESTQWKSLTTLEADTYGWSSGTIGEVKKGDYTDAKYVFRNSKWNAANSAESALGSCTTKNAGVVSETDGVYYICKSSAWTRAAASEYDTYGYACSEDGAIVNGSVNTNSKYVCDGGSFRIATSDEINLELGCSSYTQKKKIAIWISSTVEEVWHCSKEWSLGSIYDASANTLKDLRDGQVYKTVTIGTQTWMAENLNYAYTDVPDKFGIISDSTSWCYDNDPSYCAKYGRLYIWSAVMDSAAQFSENAGTQCGYGTTCIPNSPHRGICPEGWFVPTNEDYSTLFAYIGGYSTAGSLLKFTSGWYDGGNGTDEYGFSLLPAGYRRDIGYFDEGGEQAYLWTASEVSGSYAWYQQFIFNENKAYRYYGDRKRYGLSLRCLKD